MMNLPQELEAMLCRIDTEIDECSKVVKPIDQMKTFLGTVTENLSPVYAKLQATNRRLPVRLPLYVFKPSDTPKTLITYFLEPFKSPDNVNAGFAFKTMADYADQGKKMMAGWEEVLQQVSYTELLKNIRQNILSMWVFNPYKEEDEA